MPRVLLLLDTPQSSVIHGRHLVLKCLVCYCYVIYDRHLWYMTVILGISGSKGTRRWKRSTKSGLHASRTRYAAFSSLTAHVGHFINCLDCRILQNINNILTIHLNYNSFYLFHKLFSFIYLLFKNPQLDVPTTKYGILQFSTVFVRTYPGLPWFRDFKHHFLRMRSHHFMFLN